MVFGCLVLVVLWFWAGVCGFECGWLMSEVSSRCCFVDHVCLSPIRLCLRLCLCSLSSSCLPLRCPTCCLTVGRRHLGSCQVVERLVVASKMLWLNRLLTKACTTGWRQVVGDVAAAEVHGYPLACHVVSVTGCLGRRTGRCRCVAHDEVV